MGFNYAKEKMLFEMEWKKLQAEYAVAGMMQEDIESMRTYDWDMFLSRRSYENHTQPLPDAYFSLVKTRMVKVHYFGNSLQ